jgi:predicted RNA-binding Zn-ribbon protein involved in translation (DUF1610 family)
MEVKYCSSCGKKIDTTDGKCPSCPESYPYKIAQSLHAEGWVCPKCGYVWAIWVEGCRNCNRVDYTSSNTDDVPWNKS